MFVLDFPAFENKTNTQIMTVSTETVRMAKSRPGKNQLERLRPGQTDQHVKATSSNIAD